MTERYVDTRPNWQRILGIGRRATRLAQYAEELQREERIREIFDRPAWDFVEQEPYFRGEIPLINTENPTSLVAMLVEEVANGNVTKEGVTLRRPRVVEPEWADQGNVLITDRLVHERGYGDHKVPGEFDGWFTGFVIHGSNATVLLQPHQVKLTRPAEELAASAELLRK